MNNTAQKVDEVIVPELRGTVLSDGQPAAGRKLRVSRNEGVKSSCEIPVAELDIDLNGEFVFPIMAGKLATSFLQSLDSNWQMCVSSAEAANSSSADSSDNRKWRLIWYDSHSGVMFGEKFTELACDLDKLPKDDETKKSFFSRLKQPATICSVVDQF